MIVIKEIEVILSGRNIIHFENLGYEISRHFNNKTKQLTVKKGTTIIVKIEDLPHGSDIKIPVLCDYCLEEGKETICWKQVKEYNKTKKLSILKDCCKLHSVQKQIECNLANYGVKSTAIIPEVKEKFISSMIENHGVMYSGQSPELLQKTSNTIQERYGVDHYSKTDEFKEKIKDTCQEKYGVDHPMHLEEFKNKARETLYKNGTAPRSTQQIYLNNILGGELNYPISYCSLDIAFLDENKYIEYNGSGHDLNVKYGRLTEKEFKIKEIKRDYYLKSIGWSKITIISLKDFFPQDDKIIEMINYAKEYLNTGHSWIIFDIDNKLVESSQFNYTYDFGELRKVKKEDIA